MLDMFSESRDGITGILPHGFRNGTLRGKPEGKPERRRQTKSFS
jgi:hypothetical protein